MPPKDFENITPFGVVFNYNTKWCYVKEYLEFVTLLSQLFNVKQHACIVTFM